MTTAGHRLLRRHALRLAPHRSSLDRLAQAIHALLRAGSSGDPFFLSYSLELLTTHLGAGHALLVMPAGPHWETRWWSPETPDFVAPPAVPYLVQWLLQNPERTLVVKDMAAGPQVRHVGDPAGLPQAVLGCALRHGGAVRALLFVHFPKARAFSRTEYTLLEAVGGFIARVLEIEDLKQSLSRLEDALAITQAVMEDTSTRDPDTDLPNLRYLDIWQKAMLGSEQRPESLVVAECLLTVKTKRDAARLRKASEGVRAGDLVLHGGPGRILIVFQHTPRSIAHVLLLRLRVQLGGVPMGATLWVPGQEGLGLDSCRPRLEAALQESRAMDTPALVWHLPEGFEDAPPPKRRPSARKAPEPPAPAAPQAWQPIVLRKV